MKNIAIIYHDADFDGKLSNEVCRFHLKRLYPFHLFDPPPFILS